MNLHKPLRNVISIAFSLAFLIALGGSEGSAYTTNVGAAQDHGIMIQAVSRALSEESKIVPALPKDSDSTATSRPVRTDNPVACYGTCVIDCNPRQETPARPCQKRCAKHCWK